MKTKPKIEIDLTKVEDLASKLLSKEQIAISLGISNATLYNRQLENVEFLEAIKRGRQKGVAAVAEKLVNSAIDGNTTAQIFVLKTHGGPDWKDRQDVNLSGEVTVKAKSLQDMSDEELQAELERYGDKRN